MYHNVFVAVPYYVLLLLPLAPICLVYIFASVHRLSAAPMVHHFSSTARPLGSWLKSTLPVHRTPPSTIPPHAENVIVYTGIGYNEDPHPEWNSQYNVSPVSERVPHVAQNPPAATTSSVDSPEQSDGSVLLDDDITPGRYERIAGSKGQVGMRGSPNLVFSVIAEDQPPLDRVADHDAAPEKMRLRGGVDDGITAKHDLYRAQWEQRKLAGSLTSEELEGDVAAPLDGSAPYSRMLLSTSTYQRYTQKHLQYAMIPPRIVKLSITFSYVVFEVLSNRGNPNYTTLYSLCLYTAS